MGLIEICLKGIGIAADATTLAQVAKVFAGQKDCNATELFAQCFR